jgi:RimJ/RimL family protein N-acetyltransferase
MLETERLILRQWQDKDYDIYARLNADPIVMRYFPSTLSRLASDAQAERFRNFIAQNGWGLWAVELKSISQFIGFVGLLTLDENSRIPNTPFVEIGWRLSAEYWGYGYAPEAAEQALTFAFKKLALPSVYSLTAIQNKPSQRVMLKLGMINTGQDFNHPKLEAGHQLQRHCLYQITQEQWLEKSTS